MQMPLQITFKNIQSSPAVEAREIAAEAESMGSVADVEPEVSGSWSEETAEAEFLAEARDRGELPRPKVAEIEATDEREAKPLPAIEALVERIPAGVRDTLEDLFRAKFTGVRRVPTEALKVAPGEPGA
jgi:hypothetical protein